MFPESFQNQSQLCGVCSCVSLHISHVRRHFSWPNYRLILWLWFENSSRFFFLLTTFCTCALLKPQWNNWNNWSTYTTVIFNQCIFNVFNLPSHTKCNRSKEKGKKLGFSLEFAIMFSALFTMQLKLMKIVTNWPSHVALVFDQLFFSNIEKRYL